MCGARLSRWTSLIVVLLVANSVASSQTLARPGWKGSGWSAEPWWKSAIFYHIVPAAFQDSDGDGKGDLPGVAQRLDYMQSLGVDAIVLAAQPNDAGFDDLLREASRHHIRLLVTLSTESSGTLVNEARSWLTRGCAGVWLRVPPKADGATTAAQVRDLRTLTDSFPGQRVLVEDTSADLAQLPAVGAQLVTRVVMTSIGDRTDALALRVQMAQLSSVPPGSAPIVLFRGNGMQTEQDTQHHEVLQGMFAATVFLAGGATSIEAGQELDHVATESPEQVMRWTPSNRTRGAVEVAGPVVPTPPSAPRREDDYGAFVPYVPPKKVSNLPAPPDLDALPGFSSMAVATAPVGTRNNVASEDADPSSLLNTYRHLAQLHHQSAASHFGGASLLNFDADNVLAWTRSSQASRAAALLVVACNLSDASKTISLQQSRNSPPMRGPAMVPLLSSSPTNAQFLQRPSAITVAPWRFVVLSSGR